MFSEHKTHINDFGVEVPDIPSVPGLNRSEILSSEMKNSRYSVYVERYMFGMLRIKLTCTAKPDMMAPKGHGRIVRELATYKPETASKILMDLSEADDPYAFCVRLERDWNCEYSGDGPFLGDYIRLDETQETNPYRRCAKQENPAKRPLLNFGGITIKKENNGETNKTTS